MKFFIACSLTFLVFGCATKEQPIGTKTPKLTQPQQKSTTVFGEMEVTETTLASGHTFSAFLWPENAANYRILSKEISQFSMKIDQLTAESRSIDKRILSEQSDWVKFRCIADADLPDESKDIRDCQQIFLDAGSQHGCICLASNQILLSQKNKIILKQRIDTGQEIFDRIDPNPSHIENWLLGGGDPENRIGSKLRIKEVFPKCDLLSGALKEKCLELPQKPRVEIFIRLKHFGRPKMVYKTTPKENDGRITDADYDFKTSMLTFNVHEKDKNDQETGRVFSFKMEKGSVRGVPELTRFQGDINVTDEFGKTRLGTAKFDAKWTPQTEKLYYDVQESDLF